jgi:putative membrane protein
MGKKLITILFVCSYCGVLALAQYVDPADRLFIRKAAEGGMAEVKLDQLAADKASSQSVKDFGQRMAKDHGQANDQLKNMASSKGVPLPDSLDAKDKALYDRLSSLSGDAFDKAYMRAMIKDHVEDVAEFQKESKAANDQDIRSFASTTLPTLQDHLHMARHLGTEVGVASAPLSSRSGDQ